MFIANDWGLKKLKIIIHKMTNWNLITEWFSIRLINSNCLLKNNENCKECQISQCLKYLTYEEIITDELIQRGLFDYSINLCFNNTRFLVEKIRNREFAVFNS